MTSSPPPEQEQPLATARLPVGGRVWPEGFPSWARELGDLYLSGSTSLFILHGNVHDLLPTSDGYKNLSEFLSTELFGSWDVVLEHNLASGLRPQGGGDAERQQSMARLAARRLGALTTWPRDLERLFPMLDAYLERLLVEPDSTQRESLAIIFNYAQYLVPASDIDSLARGAGASLVRFLSWAQNPYIKRANMALVLVADRLSEVNERLVQSPHAAAVEVHLPDRPARERFITWAASGGSVGAGRGSASGEAGGSAGVGSAADADGIAGGGGALTGGADLDFSKVADLPLDQLAELTNGLGLVDLNVLILQAVRSGRKLDLERFRELKRVMIERQCRGLLEFIEPSYTLDLVVGMEAAKIRLRADAALITSGELRYAPMGYLICGPVGTGKTFLAECYAGTVGIPCVKLRNFRSKYVGETEGNLEQLLTVLRSLGPVVVIIDEADAALGDRDQGGDSGTSSRVFSMIASQMGDTRYRGKIIWMLLTCRPDLIPIDLKRQGRAEVHIPLFYPGGRAEIEAMFLAMGRKNKVALSRELLPELPEGRRWSGADIESIVLQAKRRSADERRATVERADLELACREFIPSAQGLEKELQELAAVLECTQMSFLPEDLRARVSAGDGRAGLQERLTAIRQILEG